MRDLATGARAIATKAREASASGALRSSAQSLGLRIIGLVSTFGLGVILARALGPAEFGVYGLVIAIATVVGTVALVGTPQLAVREISVRIPLKDWTGVKSLLVGFAVVALAVSALAGVVAVAAWWIFADAAQDKLGYLVTGVLLAPLLALTGLLASELRGLNAMFKGQFWDIVGKPLLAFVIVGALWFAVGKLDAQSALWVQILVSLIALAWSCLWIAGILPSEVKHAPINWSFGWLSAAVPLGAVDIIRQLDGAYGMFLMGWLASATDLGVFRVALSCAVVASLPATILHVVMAPRISLLNGLGSKEELQAVLRQSSLSLSVILAPVCLAAFFIGEPLIRIVFGAEYSPAWLPLFLFCVAQFCFGLFGMGPILLAMCGEEKTLFKIYLVSVGSAIALAIPLTEYFGSAGAAAAQIVSLSLIGWLSRLHARRSLGLELTFIGPRA